MNKWHVPHAPHDVCILNRRGRDFSSAPTPIQRFPQYQRQRRLHPDWNRTTRPLAKKRMNIVPRDARVKQLQCLIACHLFRHVIP